MKSAWIDLFSEDSSRVELRDVPAPTPADRSRSSSDGLDQILYDQPSDWDVVEAVKQVAAERGEPPARVALAWLMSRPAVTAPIIGATKLKHLDDAIAAGVDRGWP